MTALAVLSGLLLLFFALIGLAVMIGWLRDMASDDIRANAAQDDKQPDDAVFKPKAMKAKPDKSRQRKPAPPKLPKGFTRHKGGKCPVAGNRIVSVLYRDATQSVAQNLLAESMYWEHDGTGYDIIGYKVIKTAAQKRREKDMW